MPGNTVHLVTVNNYEELEWYIADSKIGTLVKLLEDKGIRREVAEKEVTTVLINEKPSVNELLTHKNPLLRTLTSYVLERIKEENSCMK